MGDYYTKNEYETAKNSNIIDCLNSMGYALKQEGFFYRSTLHDSMVINANSNSWHWNSKDLHGKEPINLLSAILQNDYGYNTKDAFITAIKRLAGTEGQRLPIDSTIYRQPDILKPTVHTVEKEMGIFKLPEKSNNMKRTITYLCGTRKLDYDIIKELISQKKIYETEKGHNACFVTYDKDGNPRHAFMRGTLTNVDKGFKKDVDNSDKAYAFTVKGNENSTKVYCFESSIDAISHASLYKLNGNNYKDDHRISLHGTSFLGLEQFLKNNPQITEIVSCLDNDKTGNLRSEKIIIEYYPKGFKVFRETPSFGKDFNEDLVETMNILNSRYENLQEDEDQDVEFDDD